MSEINATIIVEPIDLTVTQSSITQTVTVEPIDLSIFTTQPSVNTPGGTTGQLQYNNGTVFGGLANSSVVGGTLTFSNLANLKIAGGTANYGLITDGLGNLSWSDTTINANFASYAGNVTVSSQPNITSTGTLTGLTVSGVSDLGPESNVTITGGTPGYVLGTDGAGTLGWVAQGGAGTGNPGGANTQIQFNDSGLFGGNVGFTFNDASGIVNMPTDLIVGSDITASVGLLTVAGANISGSLNANGISMEYGIEGINLSTSTGSPHDFDFYDGAIEYKTADATANVIINFRGNSSVTLDTFLPNSHSVSGTYVMQQGTTPYQVTNVTIDSVAQTINWAQNIEPSVNPNSKIAYTFVIVKTSTTPTYDVLGSGTRYG